MKIDINFETKISITIAKTPFLSCNFYYIFLYLYKIYLYKKYYNFYYILLYFIYIVKEVFTILTLITIHD